MPIPRGPFLFDTSVYIRYFHSGAFSWLAEPKGIFGQSILTVVVAAELYAGTRSPEEKYAVDELCRAHQSLGKLSSPNGESWLEAGQMLGRYARVYGGLRMADHFRDVLIAQEAAKNQATLMTENARDYLRWQKLFRAAGRDLMVFDVRKLP